MSTVTEIWDRFIKSGTPVEDVVGMVEMHISDLNSLAVNEKSKEAAVWECKSYIETLRQR